MPVQLDTATRRYFRELSRLGKHNRLEPLLEKLGDATTQFDTADSIGDRDSELDAQFRTTVSPQPCSAPA